MERKLLEVLVCPVCHADLDYKVAQQELRCNKCKLIYKIENDIPVMLVEHAIAFQE